ncbi:MAG: DJ-1/PfpI family protein [Paraglaciecola sp.]|uniref:DJ-1/PfpI family protein n=1 Tax=Paraglaciecola sp. TaxID=1920173 RepID=UPI003298FFEB
MQLSSRSINIGIYLYDNAEVLDFSGPFEVFSTAARLQTQSEISNVFLIGETVRCINARAGFKVLPKFTIHNHPQLNVLIISGGIHANELTKPHVIEWISRQAKTVTIIASVCTGAFLLAKAGVLQGLTCTTHWENIDEFKDAFPNSPIIENVPWVDHVQVITSAGISAGIDMSLHIVEKLFGASLVLKTATQMEYHWCNKRETKC